MFLCEIPSQRVHLSLIEISDRSEESSPVSVDRVVSSRTLSLVPIAGEYSTESCCHCRKDTSTSISCLDIFFDESLSTSSENFSYHVLGMDDTLTDRSNLVAYTEFARKISCEILRRIRVVLRWHIHSYDILPPESFDCDHRDESRVDPS